MDSFTHIKSSDSLFLLILGCRVKTSSPEVDAAGVGVPLNIMISLELASTGLFHGMLFEVQLYRESSAGRG